MYSGELRLGAGSHRCCRRGCSAGAEVEAEAEAEAGAEAEAEAEAGAEAEAEAEVVWGGGGGGAARVGAARVEAFSTRRSPQEEAQEASTALKLRAL